MDQVEDMREPTKINYLNIKVDMYEKNVINDRLSKGIYKQLYKRICK